MSRIILLLSLSMALCSVPVMAKCGSISATVEVSITDQYGQPVSGSVAMLAWDDGRREPEFTYATVTPEGSATIIANVSTHKKTSIFRGDICGEPRGKLIVCAREDGYGDSCEDLPLSPRQSVALVLRRP